MGKDSLTAGRNVIGWFEMPIRRLDDAMQFYPYVFNFVIAPHIIGGKEYGIITGIEPYPNECYGALVVYPEPQPMPCSAVHFFRTKDCSEFFAIQNRVLEKGGYILMSPTPFHPLIGTYSICEDNQGTKFAIHSSVPIYPCIPPIESE